MADIPLKLDENNELTFSVEITGTDPVNSPPVVRLVCEGEKGMSYVFSGKYTSSNEVEVIIPAMKGRLPEGTYKTKLEVIMEDRYFVPLTCDAEFKLSRKIVAEVVQRKKPEPVETVKAAFVAQSYTPVRQPRKKAPSKAEAVKTKSASKLQDRYKRGLLKDK